MRATSGATPCTAGRNSTNSRIGSRRTRTTRSAMNSVGGEATGAASPFCNDLRGCTEGHRLTVSVVITILAGASLPKRCHLEIGVCVVPVLSDVEPFELFLFAHPEAGNALDDHP